MAHAEKFTKGAIYGLYKHVDRKSQNHSNELIDVSKSHLNYDLCDTEGDTLIRMNNRLEEVYMLNRKDVNVAVSWALTLPQELKEKTDQEQREFFEESYNFLTERYGKENVLSSNVHVDETTPHMHFLFMPVVYDQKNKRNKVSANDVLTRTELRSFHKDLDNHLKENISKIYKGGVLNDKTLDVKNVKELKEMQKQVDKEKEKKNALKKKYSDYNKKYLEPQAFLNNLDQTITKTKFSNEIKMSPETFDELNKFIFTGVTAMNSYNNLKKNKNKEIKRLEKVSEDHYQMYSEEFDKRIEKEEKLKEATGLVEKRENYIFILENSNKQDEVSIEQYKKDLIKYKNLANGLSMDLTGNKTNDLMLSGYNILERLENGYEPRDAEESNMWLETLEENKNKGFIPESRLDKFINMLKEILKEFLKFDLKKQRTIKKTRGPRR